MAKHEDMADMQAETESLRAEGWTTVPTDRPEEGSFGATAFRTGSGGEEATASEWKPFGELRAEKHAASSPEEFEEVLDQLRKNGTFRNGTIADRRSPAVFPCDDPVAREVGFVAYPGDGTAMVLRMPARMAGGLSRELRTEMELVRHLRYFGRAPDGRNPGG